MNERLQVAAISGNPKGQQFYGNEVLRKYSETLYSEEFKKEKANFVRCDIKEENGKTCFYYSYMVPNTLEADGRPGGYFAISIRSEEAYCEDMSRLYQLLNQLYQSKVKGVLISEQKKFLVSEFDKSKSESILQFVIKNLTNCFAASFTPLEHKLKPNRNRILRCHVSGNGCDLFLDDFFSCGSAILSPEISRADEKVKQFEAALQNSKQECADKETKLQKAQATEKDLRSKISELEKENHKIKGQLTDKPMTEKVDKLISMLDSMLNSMKKIILCAIVVLAILIAGTVLLYRKCSDKTEEGTTESNTTMVTEQVETLRTEILLDNLDTLKIRDEKLKYGDVITFRTPDDVKVKTWGLDGFAITSKSKSSDTCSVEVTKQNSGDTVTISFTDETDKKYKYQFIIE